MGRPAAVQKFAGLGIADNKGVLTQSKHMPQQFKLLTVAERITARRGVTPARRSLLTEQLERARH